MWPLVLLVTEWMNVQNSTAKFVFSQKPKCWLPLQHLTSQVIYNQQSTPPAFIANLKKKGSYRYANGSTTTPWPVSLTLHPLPHLDHAVDAICSKCNFYIPDISAFLARYRNARASPRFNAPSDGLEIPPAEMHTGRRWRRATCTICKRDVAFGRSVGQKTCRTDCNKLPQRRPSPVGCAVAKCR